MSGGIWTQNRHLYLVKSSPHIVLPEFDKFPALNTYLKEQFVNPKYNFTVILQMLLILEEREIRSIKSGIRGQWEVFEPKKH